MFLVRSVGAVTAGAAAGGAGCCSLVWLAQTTSWNVIKTPKWKYQTINTVVHLAPKFWFEKHYYHDVSCNVYGVWNSIQ